MREAKEGMTVKITNRASVAYGELVTVTKLSKIGGLWVKRDATCKPNVIYIPFGWQIISE